MPALSKKLVWYPALLAGMAFLALTGLRASAATLMVSTASLPAGEVGIAYSQTVTATGGTSPYSWTLLSGALPTGLSLNSATGALSGTPTAAGTYNFTARVSDASSATATRALTIVVSPTLTVSTASLPAGQVGLAYSQALTTTGGVAPVTWSLLAGPLPAGLSLNAATGTISGTPTATGTTNFTVQATDALGANASRALSITVQAVGTLHITTTTLPGAQTAVAYSQTLSATGGTLPYSWSISAGSLPSGLTLNPSTGVISGTPTVSGSSTFTVRVIDNSGAQDTQSFTLAVSLLQVTTASLPVATVGVPYAQALQASGGTTPYSWSIVGGALPAGLSLSSSGVVSGTPTTVGTSTVTVQVQGNTGGTGSKTFTLQVQGASTPTPTPTPSIGQGERGMHGLCNAYFSGSENGREHKRHAPPFQQLEAAADAAGKSVEAFCGHTTTTNTTVATDDDDEDKGKPGRGNQKSKPNKAQGKGRQ